MAGSIPGPASLPGWRRAQRRRDRRGSCVRLRHLELTRSTAQNGATRHVRRSCDLSSLTSSAAHSRASVILPASRKARAFVRAWLSVERSVGDSFPDRAPRAARLAHDVLRVAAGPKGPTRFQRAEKCRPSTHRSRCLLCQAAKGGFLRDRSPNSSTWK